MTTFSEAELIRHFLGQYSLEWMTASGRHNVFYDGGGNVAAVSVEFDPEARLAPKPEQVLGKTVRANDDGSIYVRVRRPEEGYWICYSKTAGEASVVKVTIQRINLNGSK